MLADGSLEDLAERDGWSVLGETGTYRPVEAGWRATVNLRTVYGRYYSRWHVAVIDSLGRCREVTLRSRLADARVVAEGRVRAENRPKAA